MNEALIVFARRPIPGTAKTRLLPALGVRATHTLYRALLLDTLTVVAGRGRERRSLELSFDAPWMPDAEIRSACSGLRVTTQPGGDLGERLHGALVRSTREGHAATVIVGADAPTMPPESIERAFAALHEGNDLVVGPSDDGGYVLVGARGAPSEPFRDVPWGGPEVLAVTRRRARDAGLRLAEVTGGRDVDEVGDLRSLRRELLDPEVRGRAPRTAAWIDREFGAIEPDVT